MAHTWVEVWLSGEGVQKQEIIKGFWDRFLRHQSCKEASGKFFFIHAVSCHPMIMNTGGTNIDTVKVASVTGLNSPGEK